ncbi:MAG: amidohydrolase family protein [Tissierellia bacterium]|nr:amidohydrolase family protein [Tissierellia bacterium]
MDGIYLIKCGKLFDGIDESLKDDYQVLIEDARIVDVGRDIPFPEYASIIDLSDYIVTPGLIDAHVHPEFFDWKPLYNDYHTYSDEWFALATIHTAKKTLQGGFTTIRAMGSLARGYGLADAKMAIEAGYFEGSRLVIAPHSMSATGGHGDLSQLLHRHSMVSDVVKSISVGSGADFFREMVRRDIKYGADFIKIIVSGGFSTINDLPDEQQLTDDELQAIFEIANIKGMPVTAHAYTHDIIEKLVGFGIK